MGMMEQQEGEQEEVELRSLFGVGISTVDNFIGRPVRSLRYIRKLLSTVGSKLEYR
jgi:hypothetical protein